MALSLSPDALQCTEVGWRAMSRGFLTPHFYKYRDRKLAIIPPIGTFRSHP